MKLIVILVILAILAAILVPALLGWIDKAKEKQYVLDARSVYMAAQAKASEKYAADTTYGSWKFSDDDWTEIVKVADTKLTVQPLGATGSSVTFGTGSATDPHPWYEITGMKVVFSDGSTTKTCTLQGDTWTVS